MFRKLQTTSYGARLNRARAQQSDWINRLGSLLIPMIESYFKNLYQQCVDIYGQHHRKTPEQLYNHGCENIVRRMSDIDIDKYFIGPNEKSLSECLKISVQAYGEVLALANRHDKKEVVSVPPIVVFIRRVIFQFVDDVSFVDLKQELHNKAAVRSWLERIIEHEVRDILPLDRFKDETTHSDEELSDAEDDAQRLSDEEEEEADTAEEKRTPPPEVIKEEHPKDLIGTKQEEPPVKDDQAPKPEEIKKTEKEEPKESPSTEEVVVVTNTPLEKKEIEAPQPEVPKKTEEPKEPTQKGHSEEPDKEEDPVEEEEEEEEEAEETEEVEEVKKKEGKRKKRQKKE